MTVRDPGVLVADRDSKEREKPFGGFGTEIGDQSRLIASQLV